MSDAEILEHIRQLVSEYDNKDMPSIPIYVLEIALEGTK